MPDAFGDILGNIPIIGDLLFADTSAQKAQESAAKASEEARARESERLNTFQAQTASKQAELDAKAKAENQRVEDELKTARETSQKQAAALQLTGGQLGPSGPTSAGLPGFDLLKKRQVAGNVPRLQQSNQITPAPTIPQAAGINPSAGGRRYV